ncbi:hypothetical protein FM037_25120 [Shewanella psychropiezotolerans]|uniref:Uncharacterized protein n=1 Tax=Shewanella psychropiezotolerans TaxID=2593655 RepID=A0ABX5X3K1_9GAMM|nr:hypothetical protein [Shewanella psychropiezotolerans]QDO85939.1 hypothetical protein FM037_25120 [Shewanella psychropiezotolerans]
MGIGPPKLIGNGDGENFIMTLIGGELVNQIAIVEGIGPLASNRVYDKLTVSTGIITRPGPAGVVIDIGGRQGATDGGDTGLRGVIVGRVSIKVINNPDFDNRASIFGI